MIVHLIVGLELAYINEAVLRHPARDVWSASVDWHGSSAETIKNFFSDVVVPEKFISALTRSPQTPGAADLRSS